MKKIVLLIFSFVYLFSSGLNQDFLEPNISGIGYYYDEDTKSPQVIEDNISYKKNIKIIHYDNFFSSKIKTQKEEILFNSISDEKEKSNLINISDENEKNKFNNKYISEEIKKQITFFKSDELKKFKEKLTSENKKWIKTPEKLKLFINMSYDVKSEEVTEILNVEYRLKTMIIKILKHGEKKLKDFFIYF